jgi:Transposase C of IS166 homeodomain
MASPTDSLPNDPSTLKAMLLAERTRAERLEQIIKEMQRYRFGRRAETLPEDQLLLGLEEVEQTAASEEADHEAEAPAEQETKAAKRRTNRGSLPSHLPRVEMVVDVDSGRRPRFWRRRGRWFPAWSATMTSGERPSALVTVTGRGSSGAINLVGTSCMGARWIAAATGSDGGLFQWRKSCIEIQNVDRG